MKANERKIYSVSQVTGLIKNVLAGHLPGRLTVEGEITNWKRHHSGHSYFSLKDDKCQLPCVMWRSSGRKLRFDIENGLAVAAAGYIDVYPPQGKYQFYVESMQPAGLGSLELAFQQIYKKLKAEGLFADEHKKSLPRFPRRIGILTSASGAAVKDITDSIYSRWPCAKLYLYAVPVQGEEAAQGIAAAIRNVSRCNKRLGLDVLIVGRGGGSREDLWVFNEEAVARAIYNCEIPIISAVGHEVDVTIADLVADARASTPTKAGVAAVPDIREVLDMLGHWQDRLEMRLRGRLDECEGKLCEVMASSAFRNPLLAVHHRQQQLDVLSGQMSEQMGYYTAKVRQLLHQMYMEVAKIEPHRLLSSKALQTESFASRLKDASRCILTGRKREIEALERRMVRVEPGPMLANKLLQMERVEERAKAAMRELARSKGMVLTARENRLGGLNPRQVLERGYSITRNKTDGKVLRQPEDVEIGDLLVTELTGRKFIESQVRNRENGQ